MIPDRTLAEYMKGTFDLTSATIRVALLRENTEYSPDSSAHEFVNDVLDGGTTGEEFSDTNYSRQTLSNVSVTENNSSSRAELDADDMTFSNLGSSTGGQIVEAVLVYRQVGGGDGTPGDDDILFIYDDTDISDLPKQTNGEDFTLSWAAEGLLTFSEA